MLLPAISMAIFSLAPLARMTRGAEAGKASARHPRAPILVALGLYAAGAFAAVSMTEPPPTAHITWQPKLRTSSMPWRT